jgi:hypothetical protein
MATSAEQLILRGLHLLIRTTFSPNDGVAQAKHFMSLQRDVGPWLTDYAAEIEKPAIDPSIIMVPVDDGEGQGGLQQ